MTQILVFGTSTTYGAWDIEGGWVQRLRKYLDEKQLENSESYYIVYNLGISGNTTKDILERIEFEAKQRLKLKDDGEEVIFLIQAGVNDAIINNKTKNFHVPIKDYERNIEKIIDISRKLGDKEKTDNLSTASSVFSNGSNLPTGRMINGLIHKVVFIGNKPVNEKLVDPIPWLPGHSYLNKFIEQYEKKNKEVCLRNKINFIDVFNIFKDKNNEMLSPDGVHLNSKGHEKMYEIVKDFLIEHKVI